MSIEEIEVPESRLPSLDELDLSSLPTPISRSIVRVTRSHKDTAASRFLALSYLAEVFLKYTVLVLHACIENLDRDSWQYWGYRLARAPSLGDWEKASLEMEQAARRAGAGGWVREILDWIGLKRTGKNATPWFSRTKEVFEQASRQAPSEDAVQPSVRGLLSSLVTLRNRTRGHGAPSDEFFRNVNRPLEGALATLIAYAEPLQGFLLYADQDGFIRELSDAAPAKVRTHSPGDRSEKGILLEEPAGTWRTRFSPLFIYAPETDDCLFVNGNWKPHRLTAEFLDYLSGRQVDVELAEFSTPPGPRPRSETAGAPDLTFDDLAAHNLPTLMESYVRRPNLESVLTALLTDRQHRIVTLHGMGGVGKTTLALKVCRDLVLSSDCPFDLILWFSARDIDLLTEGPQPRDREVSGIEEIASLYCRMLGGREDSHEALSLFADEVLDEKSRMLMVMDNFETLDDPEDAHAYLDGRVVLPNKVLITSRLRAFKGDYPVEVPGMELEEAKELLAREARRVRVEPILTEEVARKIHDYTRGIPYAMKLVVSQLALKAPLHQLLDQSLAEERILDALFLRSFRSLTPAAARLFLIAGNVGSDLSEVPLRTLYGLLGIPFEDPLDELVRASLIEVKRDQDLRVFSMPQITKKFADRQLLVHPERMDIESNLDLINRTYKFQGSTAQDAYSYASRVVSILRDATDHDTREQLKNLLETLAKNYPATWWLVAQVREELGDPYELIAEAYELAAQHDSDNSGVWQAWSRYERSQGNDRRATELLLRAAEKDPDDIGLNSHAAYRVVQLIKYREIPLDKRQMWTTTVKDNLERKFNELDPSPLARLGWLYWMENDRENARRCAERGLQLEPDHVHCGNILNKLTVR